MTMSDLKQIQLYRKDRDGPSRIGLDVSELDETERREFFRRTVMGETSFTLSDEVMKQLPINELMKERLDRHDHV